MATAFSYSTTVVHFRYPIQKATENPVLAHFQKTTDKHSHHIFHSANPVLGHATIKLLKPLHVTTRTGVRALHNGCRCEIGFNGREWKCETRRVGSYWEELRCEGEELPCEGKILNFLESNKDTNNLTTEHAEYLSHLLEDMGTHGEENGELFTLCKEILEPAHISTMWEIAGYNYTDNAADMLPLEQHPPLKWGGKGIVEVAELNFKARCRKLYEKLRRTNQFPMKGEWEMGLSCGNGKEYNVDFKGGWLSGEKRGKVLVEKNLNGIPAGVKPSDLAFVFGADRPWPSRDPFVIYTRAAGPNVLIGQAWTENNKRLWARVILVKRVRRK